MVCARCQWNVQRRAQYRRRGPDALTDTPKGGGHTGTSCPTGDTDRDRGGATALTQASSGMRMTSLGQRPSFVADSAAVQPTSKPSRPFTRMCCARTSECVLGVLQLEFYCCTRNNRTRWASHACLNLSICTYAFLQVHYWVSQVGFFFFFFPV